MAAPVHVRVDDLHVLYPLKQRRVPWRRAPRKAVHALNGVTLELKRGECLALVGESGSGKTTLANAVAGSVSPTRGTIWLDDVPLAGDGRSAALTARQRARRIQVIFQDPTSALNPRMRIDRALAEPLLVHGMASEATVSQRVLTLLERVGLAPDTATRYPHELNASQRQRVVIARALSLEPEVLIADEPIAKLDVSMQGQILNLIEELRRTLGISVIFITHDLSVVRQIATRVAVLYLGQLMEVQERERFFATPEHPYSQALLRSSPRLRFDADASTIYTISGEIPSPIDLPPGCPFLSRCVEGEPACGQRRPRLMQTAACGLVACFKRPSVSAPRAHLGKNELRQTEVSA